MDNINNRIKYFRDCYRSDNRDMVLNDFFSLDNTHLENKEELINGSMVRIPCNVPETLKATKLYSKEKDLIYCSLFIVGKMFSKNNRLIKICAPLLFYPATLEQDGEFIYLAIDKSKRRFNFSIVNAIKDEQDEKSSIYDEITDCFTSEEVANTEIGLITSILEKYIPGLNTDSVLMFPELVPLEKLKKMLQPSSLKKQVNFKLIPASGAGLFKKSVDTMGVLNELKEISKRSSFSKPLGSLIGDEDFTEGVYEKGRVPSVLNLPQEKIIRAATKYPFSLIVGPPGTGKSYTIASLAVEHISKGKSVLIASKTNQTVDVIFDKIETQLGLDNVIVRGGKSNHLKQLKNHLRNILSGMKISKSSSETDITNIRELELIDKKINKLEAIFQKRVEKESVWGNFFAENGDSNGFFKSLRKKYISFRMKKLRPLWEIIERLENSLNAENSKTVEYIQNKYEETIKATLTTRREDLKKFLQGISARLGIKQEELFRDTDFKVILSAFPVWLVKLSDIYKVLPLKEELFDLAIIDESTQCDIATIIPVLMRAKNVVFAGDPNQLRHVSFLSRSRQKSLIEKYGLPSDMMEFFNYRDKSILDIVFDKTKDQNQVVFLNEHYRSTPEIISFSNKTFYNDAIRVMTSKPNIPEKEGVFLLKCDGIRDEKGYNEIEAGLILDKVSELFNEQKSLKKGVCESIGILSPFRSQVDYLMKEVSTRFSYDQIEKHNLMVATAYGFQGEERDVMFLSFVLDEKSHNSAFIHINKRDVFNVSITRGRSIQYVCTSLNPDSLKQNSILRLYLDSIKENNSDGTKLNAVVDNFSKEVEKELQKFNVQTYTAYPVAGLEIDVIIQSGNKTFGIDLIGYPGEFENAFSLDRYKMLKRAGLRTFPLPYVNWVLDRDRCLDEIKNLIL
ncbi:MAG: hypothetical protein GY760_14855 [Deltaproteobacteria bacterium]|nr:hypothetical protein [Deltaproteobacteria bacterium]